MQHKLSPRPTFKPQLESLETRDLPSGAGIALYMQAQNIQQGVQTMQAQVSQAQTDFKNLGDAIKNDGGQVTQAHTLAFTKLAGEIQSVRALDTQINAEIKAFQQAVHVVAMDGDHTDQTLAVLSYLQVNGGLGALFGGSNNGDLSSQAHNALDQVNKIASATSAPDSNGGIQTYLSSIDEMLKS